MVGGRLHVNRDIRTLVMSLSNIGGADLGKKVNGALEVSTHLRILGSVQVPFNGGSMLVRSELLPEDSKRCPRLHIF
jgi:hypothetical protein